MEITSRLASTFAIFQRKSELISVKCGSHKNFKGPLKIKRKGIEPFHFQTDLIWWDGPFNLSLSISFFEKRRTCVVKWNCRRAAKQWGFADTWPSSRWASALFHSATWYSLCHLPIKAHIFSSQYLLKSMVCTRWSIPPGSWLPNKTKQVKPFFGQHLTTMWNPPDKWYAKTGTFQEQLIFPLMRLTLIFVYNYNFKCFFILPHAQFKPKKALTKKPPSYYLLICLFRSQKPYITFIPFKRLQKKNQRRSGYLILNTTGNCLLIFLSWWWNLIVLQNTSGGGIRPGE